MLSIKDMIDKCVEIDVENEIMTGDQALEFYLNKSAKEIIKIYEEYYGKESEV